ncbi:hypothetical protein, partial [Sphingobium yanoikuyae]|uniref:hypothetical protein n=1 Tax=Sphingobium yanoikuyae TaxID=13690 RepID=UPI0035C794B7
MIVVRRIACILHSILWAGIEANMARKSISLIGQRKRGGTRRHHPKFLRLQPESRALPKQGRNSLLQLDGRAGFFQLLLQLF